MNNIEAEDWSKFPGEIANDRLGSAVLVNRDLVPPFTYMRFFIVEYFHDTMNLTSIYMLLHRLHSTFEGLIFFPGTIGNIDYDVAQGIGLADDPSSSPSLVSSLSSCLPVKTAPKVMVLESAKHLVYYPNPRHNVSIVTFAPIVRLTAERPILWVSCITH